MASAGDGINLTETALTTGKILFIARVSDLGSHDKKGNILLLGISVMSEAVEKKNGNSCCVQ